MNRVVVGEASDAGAARDETAEDILLDTAVNQSHVHVSQRGADVEGCLCRNTTHKVDSLRVNVRLVLISIVLLTNGDTSKRGSLLTEVGYNLTSVDTRDGGDTLASTPCTKRLDSSPVAVLQGIVLNNNARSLDVW